MQKCKIWITAIAVMMMCLLMPGMKAEAADQTGYIEGTNEAVKWSYDKATKTVTITGHGECTGVTYVYGATSSNMPWETAHIKFADCSLSGNMQYLFYNMYNVVDIDFTGVTFSNINSTASMFAYCRKLKSINLSGLDTSSVTDMNHMFSACNRLESLDVSGFNTSQVTDMNCMFEDCSRIESLDLSSFDTSKVTNMYGIFAGCSILQTVNVSSFDTGNVTSMKDMFWGCQKLESADVSGFDTSNVTDMSLMFYGCNRLEPLDVSGFDTSKVTDMGSMFYACKKVKSLDVSNFDTSNVTLMGTMFYNCPNLESLDVSGFDTSKVTNMGSMFWNCASLKTVDVSGFDTSKVTTMYSMFQDCNSLESLDVSSFDTSKVTTMYSMFAGCSSLKTLDVSGFDTGKVTNMISMFNSCSSLKRINLSSFQLLNTREYRGCEATENMLLGCETLLELHTPSDMGDDTIVLPVVFNDGESDISVIDKSTQNMVLRRGSTSARQLEPFVKRMYTVALGREAETDGLIYWSSELAAKRRDGADLAVSFLLSEEFLGKGYGDSDYIGVLYTTFFDRDADEVGNAYWCEQLAAGASRKSVLSGFVNSQEFFDICAGFGISRGVLRSDGSAVNPGIYRFSERLYSTILERAGDKGGIEYWTCAIDAKTLTPEDAAISFFFSEEYTSKNTSDEMYIKTLYRTFMDREADEAGLEYWKNVLSSTGDRHQVLRDFAWSPEFKAIMAEYGL